MRFIMVFIMLLNFLNGADKVALVIGNKNYTHHTGLNNPIHDAKLIRDLLKDKRLGYEVIEAYDTDIDKLLKKLRLFKSKATHAKIAVIYYAGHGLGVYGKNYLVPIGAKELDIDELDRKLMKVDELKNAVAKAKVFGVVFFDACRNSFFNEQILGLPVSKDGSSRALVPPTASKPNVLVSFSTQPGTIAKDDVQGGKHSPYALALQKNLMKNRDIRRVMGGVKDSVLSLTNRQQPVSEDSLGGNQYCLTGSCPSNEPKVKIVEKIVYVEKPINTYEPQPIKIHESTSIRKYSYEPEMIRINRGGFMRGSESGDSDEKPVQRVNIGYDFEIGKYEVTIGEYKNCVKGGACPQPEWLEKGNNYNIHTGSDDYYKKMCLNDNCPIMGVSWHNAKAYAKWLSQKTGKQYRLPTEAEWEYAARAGTTSKWSFGNSEGSLKNYAWYRNNSNSKTHPVGTKQPNPWGLYDVHGNVWEWCEDWYVNNYNNTPKDGRANTNKEKNKKVLRGGSWVNVPFITRSAFRYRDYPTDRIFSVGFRLQRTLP